MVSLDSSQVTRTIKSLEQGDESGADALLEVVYDELRRLAAGLLKQEPVGHTLQPTALVHEVFLKLVDQNDVDFNGRSHFFAISAQAMRRILVDHARGKGRAKRGGKFHRVDLDESRMVSPRRVDDVLAIDEALERLAKIDARQARVVELRFFGGLTVEETAAAMGLSKRTIENEWKFARAWLRRELSEESDS